MTVGTYVEPSKTTLAAYLDMWLADVKSRVSPRTHERYAEFARKNIVPMLGNVSLKDLRPAQISRAYSELLESGHRKVARTGGRCSRKL